MGVLNKTETLTDRGAPSEFVFVEKQLLLCLIFLMVAPALKLPLVVGLTHALEVFTVDRQVLDDVLQLVVEWGLIFEGYQLMGRLVGVTTHGRGGGLGA